MNTLLILIGFIALGLVLTALVLLFALAMCARDFGIPIREQIRRFDAADHRFIRRMFGLAGLLFFQLGALNAAVYNSPKPDPLGVQVGTTDNGWRVFRTPDGKVYAIPPKGETE